MILQSMILTSIVFTSLTTPQVTAYCTEKIKEGERIWPPPSGCTTTPTGKP